MGKNVCGCGNISTGGILLSTRIFKDIVSRDDYFDESLFNFNYIFL
jgi:hypothetical protein